MCEGGGGVWAEGGGGTGWGGWGGGGDRRGCRVRTSVVGGCGEMFMERDAD